MGQSEGTKERDDEGVPASVRDLLSMAANQTGGRDAVLATLLETARVIVLLLDPEGRILYFNRYWRRCRVTD